MTRRRADTSAARAGRAWRSARAGALLCAGALACSGAIGPEGDWTDPVAAPGTPPRADLGGAAGGSVGPLGGVLGAAPPPAPPTCAGPAVGHAPLRRLTRAQYANAVRELLGISRVSTSGLTPDETVGAFHSNGVSAATDLVAEQYMESAEALVRQALPSLEARHPCDRAAMGDAGCGAQFIERFGLRAYRRPLSSEEKGRYRTLLTKHLGAGYLEALRVVAQTMLQSPHFLYHVESLEPAPAGPPGAVTPLGPYALAARLAFFLWNGIPDETLLGAAAGGQLASRLGIAAQVERMLAHARARESLASFHLQWLDLEGISGITKDTRVFPAYTSVLRDAMRAETVAFVDHVVRRGDGKLETLLAAPFSIIDGPLFALYGVARPAGFQPGQVVRLENERAGLLTQASFLSVHAHADQSSPVARGVIVRKSLLCQDLPDPPPDVESTAPDLRRGLTTRERFSLHKKDPSCAGCHRLIDDVGFGFERYDGIGALRVTENGKPIDARGELVAAGAIDGPFEGAVELARKLAASREVEGCVTRQWFRYALGRFEDPQADACTLAQVQAAFAGAGRDVRALIAALAASDAFRFRRAVEDATGRTP